MKILLEVSSQSPSMLISLISSHSLRPWGCRGVFVAFSGKGNIFHVVASLITQVKKSDQANLLLLSSIAELHLNMQDLTAAKV